MKLEGTGKPRKGSGLMAYGITYRPTREEVKNFIASHCLDCEEEGKDRRSGHGLFILPNQPEPVKITMKIGEKTATVNGKQMQLDVAPFTKNDRTMVPIRFVAEALGANVDYIPKEQRVEIIL
ncbi:MAG: copper amine oxidase N-terminal domain-containing protein [Peptococcaceae bacterium]|nr:copper amine oxidase N-terminal domain-containing protein [Peptococcaceae bacterium]